MSESQVRGADFVLPKDPWDKDLIGTLVRSLAGNNKLAERVQVQYQENAFSITARVESEEERTEAIVLLHGIERALNKHESGVFTYVAAPDFGRSN